MKQLQLFSRTRIISGVLAGMFICLLAMPFSANAARKQPTDPPYLYAGLRPYCTNMPIRAVAPKNNEKVVALTFDDGPWPVNTDKILDSLAKYSARSTFFMVSNNARQNPEIAKRVLKRGHEIANHSKTHSTYSPSKIAAELAVAQRDLKEITGVTPWLFRSPGLTTGPAINNFAASSQMCNISTDNDLGDWRSPRVSAATICARFKQQLHPGYIALMHDGGSHSETVKAVPCILAYAKKQGYKFATVSQLLNMGPDIH